MSQTSRRQVDPDERRLNIGVTVMIIAIVVVAVWGLHDDVSAWLNRTTVRTENVQVCPNAQPPFTDTDWKLFASYPPPPGIYKVTYSKGSTDGINSIKMVSTDTSRCS
jgi:hypothetical protein